MRQFSFETNIQERMPWNGKVFYVKRMTSDYAECFPFNVDQFIEDVYQKYVKMADEDPYCRRYVRTREELHQQWVKTLSVTRPSGDKTVCPYTPGTPQPALMDVWHKAGDFWRRGLRIGDTLPQIVPPCKITRLPEGGWICLFPNEMHLLDGCCDTAADTTEVAEPAATIEEESHSPRDNCNSSGLNVNFNLESVSMNLMAGDTAEASAADSAACEAESSVLTDDTDGDGNTDEDKHQCDVEDTAEASPISASPLGVGELQVRGQEATETNASAAVGIDVATAPEPFVTQREILAERRHRRRMERERIQRSYEERMEREALEAEQAAREEERRKIFAAVGAVAVTAVMIYFFGLLGPAVFGLLAGGILKG